MHTTSRLLQDSESRPAERGRWVPTWRPNLSSLLYPAQETQKAQGPRKVRKADTGACGAKLVGSTFTGGLELLACCRGRPRMVISTLIPGMARFFCSSDNVARASLPEANIAPVLHGCHRIGATVEGKAPKGLCNVRLLTPTKTWRTSIPWMRCFKTAKRA